MGNNKIFQALISFILVLFLFVSVAYAWFTISAKSRIQDMAIQVNSYDVQIILEVKKNDGIFENISAKAELDAFFNNALPDDSFYFRITLLNASTKAVTADVKLNKITSNNVHAGFNMLDVFYLADGRITVNSVDRTVEVLSEDPVIINSQQVNLFRFSNILNELGDLTLADGITVAQNETIIFEFTIIYDYTTSDIGYQEGTFAIDSIFVKLN